MPDTAGLEAAEAAARLAEGFLDRDQSPSVTLSIGAASLSPGEPNALALFRDADKALCRAKAGGRHRAELAGREVEEEFAHKPAMREDIDLIEEQLREAKHHSEEALSVLDTFFPSAPASSFSTQTCVSSR